MSFCDIFSYNRRPDLLVIVQVFLASIVVEVRFQGFEDNQDELGFV
jgi:hypothetical protein